METFKWKNETFSISHNAIVVTCQKFGRESKGLAIRNNRKNKKLHEIILQEKEDLQGKLIICKIVWYLKKKVGIFVRFHIRQDITLALIKRKRVLFFLLIWFAILLTVNGLENIVSFNNKKPSNHMNFTFARSFLFQF